MSKKSRIIKEGMIVTLASFFALAAVFMLYYLIFMFFETVADQDGSYGFVSILRVGYGIIWLGLALSQSYTVRRYTIGSKPAC